MTAQPGPAAGEAPKAGGSLLWVQGLACGALLTFAAPTALLAAATFAPALACRLVETSPNRAQARSVGLACAAAAIGPIWRLWVAGGAMQQAWVILSEPWTLPLAWGAGAGAWALCQTLPVLLRTMWDARDAARARTLAAELKACREAWRLDVGP
jgi:hypothetical protein